MELTETQKVALGTIVSKVRAGTIRQTLGGYAGTGKSVLVTYLAKFFPNFGVCAYTGKAANVLRKKGLDSATTIHSRIYKPHIEWGKLLGFYLADTTELGCKGFIVDEASMVSSEIYGDLISYNYPCIFVGDHGQLEPIGTNFNLMQKPDITLEEIHRNASDIAKFAERLRHGYKATSFKGSDVVKFKGKRLTDDDLVNTDQIICAFNKTRVEMNNRVRSALGYEGKTPNVGERIICLKNNKNLGLFNGMQGVVKNIGYDMNGIPRLDFEFDGQIYPDIMYDKRWFGVEKPVFDYFGKDHPIPFDFAYCITAHKAQGDEFERVLVIEQKCDLWDHKRWAYTSASRARSELVWVS
jgi:exodeoxyribonuclease-5